MMRSRSLKITCAVMIIGMLLMTFGCNGGGGQGISPPPNLTVNTVTAYYAGNSSLDLPFAIAGEGAFDLLVNGTGFTASTVVEWNGNSIPTTFGDGTDLKASVPSSLIAVPGSATIKVSDSGATSNSVNFQIASPATATAGVVQLISVASDGSAAGADSLVGPSINADGRYVAFQSAATNLVPGASSGYQEIYERDTCIGAPSGCTPSTIRITVTYDGSPVNAHSRDSAISADGRYVVFDSQATNLLPGTSVCAGPLGSCVFLRDTCKGATTGCSPSTSLISVASDGSPSGGANPYMSSDGRFVAFNSNSPNVVIGDSGGVGEAFVRDTCLGEGATCTPSNTLISVPFTGTQDSANTGLPTMSSNSRYFAFQSWATNIIANETVVPGDFWRDTCVGASASCAPSTVRVDVANDGSQPNNSVTNDVVPSMSADGRLVAFGSTATNLVAINVNGGCANVYGCAGVYVRDTCAGVSGGCTTTTSLVSLANDGSVGNCSSPSQGLSMAANGRFVAFDSIATNLSPDDTYPACGWEDIFVRDTCFGVASGCVPSTVRVSVVNTPNAGTSANASSGYPAISADGHYVAFISNATNLFPGATNGLNMVFLAKTGF